MHRLRFNHKSDMTEGDPLRLIMVFSIPLFLGNIFQMLYNMADAAVVGRFISSHALAAVGAASPGYNLIMMLITGFTSGSSVIISQAFGSGDEEALKKSYTTAISIIMLSGAVFTFIGFAIAEPVLHLLKTPDEVFHDTWVYMMWMCGGILATCLYNCMASILRAVGNSLTPLIALVISSLLNIVLDLLFVIVFDMGIAGAAFATVLSQLISGVYCLVSIYRNQPLFRIKPSQFRIDPALARENVRLGLPAAMSSGVVILSVMLIQRAVNSYGPDIMAAYTISGRAEHIGFSLSFSIGMAVGVFVAQNKGAQKFDRVIEGLRTGTRISLLYHVVMGTLMYIGAPLIVRIFSSDEYVLDVSTGIIHITACFAPVLGLVFIFQNFLRNVSDVFPTILMSGAEIFCRGLLPFLLASRLGYRGIWWATPIGWTLSLLIGYLRYRSGAWRRVAERTL